MRKKLTANEVKALKPPATGESFVWDTELTCFGVKLTPARSSYVVQCRINGKTVKHVVGKVGEIKLQEARTRAMKALGDMRSGINLNLEKAAKQARTTTLAQAYTDFKSSRPLRPRTVQTYDENINRCLSDWLDKPLVSITKDMVEKRHKKLSSTYGPRGKGEASANQAMRLLRVILNYASVTYEDAEGQPLLPENPVKRLSQINGWNKVQPRDTIIQENDLAAWYEAVMILPQSDTLRDFFLFLIFSGLRRNEAMQLKWLDIDTKAKILTIPADIAKTGKKRQLPLTDMLQQILTWRKDKMVVGNPYIFPRDKSVHPIVEPKRAVQWVREKSKVNWSPHDLRRTYATIGSRLDVSYYKLKHLLGHSVSGDVTGNHYVQVDVETLKEPAQRIASYLEEKMGIKNSLPAVASQDG